MSTSKRTKRCHACRTAPWTCRGCGAAVCEHLCGNKTADGMATCTACKLRPAAAKATP